MPIDGIPVDSKEIEELCSKCRKPLTLRTFLNLQRKERIFAIQCKNCRTEPVQINAFKEGQNSSQLKEYLPKEQTFITKKPR